MNLTPQEAGRMEYLLGKSRLSYLTNKEEEELRYLITKEQPSAKDSSIDELIKLGLILVGLYFLSKALSKK
ncbi:hypothetical protein ANME2D_02058 [Candidatus Methanoperedens nitroreducens]|uniref:Uncharacterized protein n=1 Tax=Candidatus Methanoperedens nitratireducens TaxID=1392998 RepID=A0A062UWE5_9EURY|nr:hypothetical protein [Candidatus Methanoperedens nitroreducens]KCZ71331.1 hypothetical protein ANME2D_02058 [Candidatus Methanoperedens nitroreducens]MDJ1420960.1 hypothetical protein [Candidatus Methanoperedens sp.]